MSGKDEQIAWLREENARLTALNDVAERKLGEIRDTLAVLTRERDEARAKVGRLRAITSPVDTAAFEEHMAAREAHWVAQVKQLEGLILLYDKRVPGYREEVSAEAYRIRAQREEGK